MTVSITRYRGSIESIMCRKGAITLDYSAITGRQTRDSQRRNGLREGSCNQGFQVARTIHFSARESRGSHDWMRARYTQLSRRHRAKG
jgi:hypothetical protein